MFGANARRRAHPGGVRIAIVVAAACVVPATAAAGPSDAEVVDDVSVTAGGAVDTAGSAAATAGATGSVTGPHGETVVSGNATLDVERTPWLSAPRELLAAPYTAVSADGFADAQMTGQVLSETLWSWPVEFWGSAITQGGQVRFVLGMEHNVIRGCRYRSYGEQPTCIAIARMRVSEIFDELRRYTTVVGYVAPVTGVPLGPVRADVAIGGGEASRGLRAMREVDELRVAALIWDVRARTRAGGVDLSVASRREPFAAPDGSMSLEDRVETVIGYGAATRFTLTGYAARTRWWTDASTMRSADTLGAELAVSGRIAGFDVLARAAVGRSYYPALDATLRDRPTLGARFTLDLRRSVTVYRARRPAGS